MPTLTVQPGNLTVYAPYGENLFEFLRSQGLTPKNFCGGRGTCGKCTVLADGKPVLSCRTYIDRDMRVELPRADGTLLQPGEVHETAEVRPSDTVLAYDIGTTTMVGALMTPDGQSFTASLTNPGAAYGADVISRVQAARKGAAADIAALMKRGMNEILNELTADAGITPGEIRTVTLVGNPAMQQLLLELPTDNLVRPPFVALSYEDIQAAADAFPFLPGARLITLPQSSGYVGADTLGCLLATRLYEKQKLSLLVDIGTNGEIVLGSRDGLLCTATAAGPALEGAGISCGMRATEGAIRCVREDGSCEVIGDGPARGLCGSGLVDACAYFFKNGQINERGRISAPLELRDGVSLTQEDIRAVQTAKGAIAAGIRLLARARGIALSEIDKVFLAGAFGSAIDPERACDIGLLPEELRGRVVKVGNAALGGAKQLAADPALLTGARAVAREMTYHNLAADPRFELTFALSMYFPGTAEDDDE